jgi:hypothetical protein
MFIRFVVCRRSENPWAVNGVFVEANKLVRRRKNRIPKDDVKVILNTFAWFNKNIPCPPFFACKSAGFWTNDTVSWFRNSAKEPINKLRRLIAILRKHKLMVRTMRKRYPGKIRYRDKFQVVADTPAKHLKGDLS